LIAYEEGDLSNEGKAKWEKIKKARYDEASLGRYEKVDTLPVIEDLAGWKILPSTYVIEYIWSGRSLRCTGVWRVRQEKAFVPIGSSPKHRLILFDEIVHPPFDLYFPKKDQRALGQRIRAELVKRRRKKIDLEIDLPLDNAGKLLWSK